MESQTIKYAVNPDKLKIVTGTDEFGNVYGIREAQKKLCKKLGLKDMPQLILSEYGTPYGMLGASETDEIFSQSFKSEKEYLII